MTYQVIKESVGGVCFDILISLCFDFVVVLTTNRKIRNVECVNNNSHGSDIPVSTMTSADLFIMDYTCDGNCY